MGHDRNLIAVELKSIRKRWGLSIQDLAEIVNVDERTIYKWESGEDMPVSSLTKWSDALGYNLTLSLRKGK